MLRQLETLPLGPDGEDVLAALEAGLGDTDPMARCQALASRGVYLPRLLRHLEPSPLLDPPEPDPGFPVRAAALLAPVTDALVKALDAKDGRRLRALVALGLYPGEGTLAALERESAKAENGLLVAESLARQGGPGAARVLADMILKVQSPFRPAQVAQLRFVPSPQGAELVKRAIRKGDAAMVTGGAIALEGLTGPDVADLARAASQRFTDGWATLQALESLRRQGKAEFAPLVIQLVEKAEHALVKAVGLRVLGYLQCDDVVSFLLGSFRMLAEPLRPFALESLVLAGAPERDVRPLLDGLVSSPKLALALPAVKAMLAFDPDLAVGLISQILARPEPMARFIGAQCLAFVHTEAAREQLAVMVREDQSTHVRVQALMALAQLSEVPGAAEAAAEGLTDPAPEVRRASARVLCGLPSGATIAPELLRLLEEGFHAEPDAAHYGAWARAVVAHAGPDVVADRVQKHAKSDPVRAAFLVRAADPGNTLVGADRQKLARECDSAALKAELYLAMLCAGEPWGAEELGKTIASGSEREAVEACAAVERLGMLLPAAHGLTRTAGLVAKVDERAASSLDGPPEELTTTSRLKALAGGERGLDAMLAERARQAPKAAAAARATGAGSLAAPDAGRSVAAAAPPPPEEPKTRPTLQIQAIPENAREQEEGMDGLSPYTSHSLQQKARPAAAPRPALADRLAAVRDQLGWLGIAWVIGLMLLFGHILVQLAGMGGVGSLLGSAGVIGVEKVAGTVQLERGGTAVALTTASELPAQGEAVITGQFSRVSLKVGAKGSRVALGERGHASLTRVSVSPDRIEVGDVKGMLLADVKAGDPAVTLRLEHTSIALTDAKVLVMTDAVYVGRGQAVLRSTDGEVTVKEGKKVQLEASGKPDAPVDFPTATFQWEPE